MNTKDLRSIIMGEIKDLKEGKTTNSKAANVARLAQAAISAKKVELQVAKFRLESKETEKPVDL